MPAYCFAISLFHDRNYFGEDPNKPLRTVYCNHRMVADYGFIPSSVSNVGSCYEITVGANGRRVTAHLRDDNLAPPEVLALLRDGVFRARADAVAPPCAAAFDAAVAKGPVTLQSELVMLRSWRRWLVAEKKKLGARHGRERARLEALARASEPARRFVEESRVVKDVLKVAEGERRIVARAIAHVERLWADLLLADKIEEAAFGWQNDRKESMRIEPGTGQCAFISSDATMDAAAVVPAEGAAAASRVPFPDADR